MASKKKFPQKTTTETYDWYHWDPDVPVAKAGGRGKVTQIEKKRDELALKRELRAMGLSDDLDDLP